MRGGPTDVNAFAVDSHLNSVARLPVIEAETWIAREHAVKDETGRHVISRRSDVGAGRGAAHRLG